MMIICLVIGLLYTVLYAGIHAIAIYPVYGSSPLPCGVETIHANHGRLESLTYTVGFIPWIYKVNAYLVCGENEIGSDVVLPIHRCPISILFNDAILLRFINKHCLPMTRARELVDRLTVKPDPDYPPGSLILYTDPWDHSPETSVPIYSIRDAPMGDWYVHLRSEPGDPQFYELVDSFIERIYTNASLPTVDELRTNGVTTILKRFNVNATQWINYVEYNRDWQRLVYTVSIHTSGEFSECCVCLDEKVNPGHKDYVNCGHCFHTSCVREWISVSGRNECPLCRARNIVTT